MYVPRPLRPLPRCLRLCVAVLLVLAAIAAVGAQDSVSELPGAATDAAEGAAEGAGDSEGKGAGEGETAAGASAGDEKAAAESATPSPVASTPAQADNDTLALGAFVLNVMTENDASFETVAVFKDAVLTGPFANCSAKGEGDSSACYVDDVYVDRISFRFQYERGQDGYRLAEPTVAVGKDDEGSAAPLITEFLHDTSSRMGAFSVLYNCEPSDNKTSIVSLHLPVTETSAVDVSWSKVCGQGKFEYTEFGIVAHSGETVEINADGTFGESSESVWDVGPIELSSDLTLQLKPPALLLDFMAPTVASDNEEVGVSLRTTLSAGTLSADKATKFTVLYECKSNAQADISFTLAIPPWQNVTASWKKDCGGNHAQGLLIGTSGPGSFEVLQDGELDPRFNTTEKTDLQTAYNAKVHEVGSEDDEILFYLSNADDASDIHIQAVAMTMSKPDVLVAKVEKATISPLMGDGYVSAAGTSLTRQESKKLRIHFYCKQAGSVVVLVTLPTLRFKNVEFGFIKDCAGPHVYKHSGFLRTADSLLLGVGALVIFGGSAAWYFFRRRRAGSSFGGPKYTVVPREA